MSVGEERVPDRGVTHAGVFHADDVFSTALLELLNPDFTVSRVARVPEGFDGIVYDIGGGEFDHHQPGARVRGNGVPYASFGLLWERFGRLLLDEQGARDFERDFVQPIDEADNTGRACALSQCVSDFNPAIGADACQFDQAFREAVEWARGVLERRVASVRAECEARDTVLAAMSACDGRVLVLGSPVPWKRYVVDSGYAFVVFPSARGGFSCQCVPERLGDGSMLIPLPEAWRGLPADDLRRVTGIADAEFCHRSGFLCSAGSLSGAVGLAERALSTVSV